MQEVLTNNGESDEEGAHRLRGDLTLVDAGVSLLRPLDVQRPVLGLRGVRRLEPLVWSVRVPAHSQDVQVTVTYPWNLPTKYPISVYLLTLLPIIT